MSSRGAAWTDGHNVGVGVEGPQAGAVYCLEAPSQQPRAGTSRQRSSQSFVPCRWPLESVLSGVSHSVHEVAQNGPERQSHTRARKANLGCLLQNVDRRRKKTMTLVTIFFLKAEKPAREKDVSGS